MISAFSRKARHVLGDPVLRRWLSRRAMGLEPSRPAFTLGAPPYLVEPPSTFVAITGAQWSGQSGNKEFRAPIGTTVIDLPGQSVEVTADDPGALFRRNYSDLETLLGAHRFAWVPLAGTALDPDWVAAIWQCWAESHGADRAGWPWHAYTAAERAINIIDFADRFGLPGNHDDTLQLLARHGETIRSNLEYSGEHYTSNHLSNNGRGLLRIGIALGLEEFARDGARILIAEAGRIFGRSGILNEGSSHYHLLVTRNYIDAWLSAKKEKLKEAAMLGDIAMNALAAIPGLCLPGGMPLIGDISPDAPPEYFAALTAAGNQRSAWPAVLNEADRTAVENLIARTVPVPPDRLGQDGWHRFETDGWHALAFVPPAGWPPMPGHGHQDIGSFELHDGEIPVLVDPGRGSYADAAYTRADVHCTITIDGHDPAPVNRPYYSYEFRRRFVAQPPEFEWTRTGRILRSYGFARLSGIGMVEREWRFTKDRLTILDRIEGQGKRRIDRHYFTSADVEIADRGATLRAGCRQWRLSAENTPVVKPAARWIAYGKRSPGNVIDFGKTVNLPFEGVTILERL
jgi:hypothetical protein